MSEFVKVLNTKTGGSMDIPFLMWKKQSSNNPHWKLIGDLPEEKIKPTVAKPLAEVDEFLKTIKPNEPVIVEAQIPECKEPCNDCACIGTPEPSVIIDPITKPRMPRKKAKK